MTNATTPTPPSLPTPSPAADPPARDRFEPMEGDLSLANTFDTLLKKPGALLFELHRGERSPGRLLVHLLLTSVVCLLAFGLMLGFHSGGTQLWAAPVKVTLGVLAASLITLPSLYVFSCLNGLDVTARALAGLLAAAVCLMSLLLLGLAPVAWIFSQSTREVAFFGFLALAFWLTALAFGLGLVLRAARLMGVKRRFHLLLWAAIYVVVTLQMTTTLRPIVGTSDRFFAGEKRFFITHWLDHLDGDGRIENGGWR